jgi:hypothetical protein
VKLVKVKYEFTYICDENINLCSLEVIHSFSIQIYHSLVSLACIRDKERRQLLIVENKDFFFCLSCAVYLGYLSIGIHCIVYRTRLAPVMAVLLYTSTNVTFWPLQNVCVFKVPHCVKSPNLNRNCWKYNMLGHFAQASGLKEFKNFILT